jgi:DNA-directed RNA polymerase alpha subunit
MLTGDINMNVKSNIGKLIDESPYNREYVRKHFGKTKNTISNWCTGKSYPSVPELFELAKLLGRWVDDMYEEVKEERNPLDEDIYELDFSLRTYNALKRSNVNTINDLLKCNLKKVRGLGQKAIEEVMSKLKELEK